MKYINIFYRILFSATILFLNFSCKNNKQDFFKISVIDYVNKMKAAWIGQMAGVGWGGPTEFKWIGQIMPQDQIPLWKPGLINQFGQDDIYVEMTFLRTVEEHGMDVSIRQAGIDFDLFM